MLIKRKIKHKSLVGLAIGVFVGNSIVVPLISPRRTFTFGFFIGLINVAIVGIVYLILPYLDNNESQ